MPSSEYANRVGHFVRSVTYSVRVKNSKVITNELSVLSATLHAHKARYGKNNSKRSRCNILATNGTNLLYCVFLSWNVMILIKRQGRALTYFVLLNKHRTETET